MKKTHELEKVTQGKLELFQCRVCLWKWKQEPSEECPGVPRYGYENVPEYLVSLTEMRRRKLISGPIVGCYKRTKSPYDYLFFYDTRTAQPKPERSEKQQQAAKKMQEALRIKYTCVECGYHDRANGKSKWQDAYAISTEKLENGEERRVCSRCIQQKAHAQEKEQIQQYYKDLFEKEKSFLVLDTETTGLPHHTGFQMVEIAIVDQTGSPIFQSLLKPDILIPPSAVAIHGITNAMVATAPTFQEIALQLAQVLAGHTIYTYNAGFDWDALERTADRFKRELPEQDFSHWHCVMNDFAAYYGEERDNGEYRWQTLFTACHELGVENNGYHRALGDALNCLGVMRKLAERAKENLNE